MRENKQRNKQKSTQNNNIVLDTLKHVLYILYHTYPLFCCKGHIRNDHNTINIDTKSNGINKMTTVYLRIYITLTGYYIVKKTLR